MAPEYPPGLVVFDARLINSVEGIIGDLHYIEVPVGQRLRVRWEGSETPEDFISICDGVAFVQATNSLQIIPISRNSKPDKISENLYRWTEGLNEGIPWIMFILILPNGYSITQSHPKPARAKQFKNDRIAAYWILKGDEIGRTSVDAEIIKTNIEIHKEASRINRELTAKFYPKENSIISVIDKSPYHSEQESNSNPPTVFISYSWDSDDHKRSVLELAKTLFDNGVNVLLDQYELGPGKNMFHFMENAIPKADKVLIIFTPNYKLKAEKREGGVGFEYSILNSELYRTIATNNKFIPILKNGTLQTAIPNFMQQFIAINMTGDNLTEKIKELLLAIYDRPQILKPRLGKRPSFE